MGELVLCIHKMGFNEVRGDMPLERLAEIGLSYST